MEIREGVSLKTYNTFGFDVACARFLEIHSEEELLEAIEAGFTGEPRMVLGGGSNILLTRDYRGTIIKNEIGGKNVIREDDRYSWVRCGGGVAWHELVVWSLEQDLCGLENMSLIPGSVGAAPIQNIGAYGRELKDVFDHLEAIDLNSGEKRSFNKAECQFGYRDSIFKREARGQYMITEVVLKLNKQVILHTAYGAIQKELESMGISSPGIHDVSQAVINIRRSKLPDPKEIGNSGSFFKNPVVSERKFEELRSKFPNIPHYPAPDGIKLAAGWLIDQCGWKGFREHDHGVHEFQALVLVNYGAAKGREIYDLSERILRSVQDRFGVELEREVQVI